MKRIIEIRLSGAVYMMRGLIYNIAAKACSSGVVYFDFPSLFNGLPQVRVESCHT